MSNSRIVAYLICLAMLILTFVTGVQASLTWAVETVDSRGEVGYYTSIAVDSLDRPHISYYDIRNGDLKYARWTGRTWAVETVDSKGSLGETSIALDSLDRPHISYTDYTNKALKYARWTGRTWAVETVYSAGSVGWDTSIALDSKGNVHISCYDGINVDLKYVKRTILGTWAVETVDSRGEVGYSNSIAVDSLDRPHIGYYDMTNEDLRYARWTGRTWAVETVDSRGDVGYYTSIAVDSLDRPHISYADETEFDLKYARWTGLRWFIEIVDSKDWVGRYTSIALDSSDRPHISYQKGTGVQLTYATQTGTRWSIEILDANIIHTSIAVDSRDRPHISYLDTANWDLKYATKVQKLDTEINFKFQPNPANPGKTVLLSGTLEGVLGNPVYPAQVKVEYSLNGVSWNYIWTLDTNAVGIFSKSFTAPGVGAYLVKVSYLGSSKYNPSSHTETLVVQTGAKVDTQLSFTFTPNPARPGRTVLLSGTLKDVHNNPVYPAQVQVYYSLNGGASWNHIWTLTTNTAGEFSKTFTAPSTGRYLVGVLYSGSASYNRSTDIETLVVQ